MPSLLLTVFLLQIFIHIIGTLGSSYLTEVLWGLFNTLPGAPTASAAAETRRLKREVVRLKRELAATSAQDDFARWAKLRRAHDKATAAHEQAASSLSSARSRFSAAATALRWLGTTGLRFALQMWFSRAAMFWIPRGWVPGPVEWVLCFPRAPRGSVSVQVWWIACASVVALVDAAIRAVWLLVRGETVQGPGMGKGARMFMEKGEVHRDGERKAKVEEEVEEKKEL